MDGSLTRGVQLWLTVVLLVLQCATSLVAASDGCLSYQMDWVRPNLPAYINCGLTGEDHFWWRGTEACDPSGFVRTDLDTNGCEAGSPTCQLSYSLFSRESSTIVCCSENGATSLEEARETDCYQIAICPHDVEMRAPTLVETGKTASVYMKVTTKPYPPPSLQLVRVKVSAPSGSKVVNLTNSYLVPPAEGAAENALDLYYAYEFQVPVELVEPRATLKIEPRLNELPTDASVCTSINLRTVSNIPILSSGEPTATTESPTQSTTATPLECTSEPTTKETTGVRSDPVSGGLVLRASDCNNIILGVSAGLVVLLTIALCVSILIHCYYYHKRRGGKDLSRRKLPKIPVIDRPPFQLHVPPGSIPNCSSSNGTLTTTPTPTEGQRLLAGQTPNGCLPVEPHPLNHSFEYVTTYNKNAMFSGTHDQPPLKSALPSNEFFSPDIPPDNTSELQTTIISTVGDLQVPSQDNSVSCSEYARHGDAMEFGRLGPQEECEV